MTIIALHLDVRADSLCCRGRTDGARLEPARRVGQVARLASFNASGCQCFGEYLVLGANAMA